MPSDRKIKNITFLSSQTITAVAGGASSLVQKYAEIVVYIDCTSRPGAENLIVKMQDSPDDEDWYDIADAAVTVNAVKGFLIRANQFGKFIRPHYTPSGSGEWTLSVKGVAKT